MEHYTKIKPDQEDPLRYMQNGRQVFPEGDPKIKALTEQVEALKNQIIAAGLINKPVEVKK